MRNILDSPMCDKRSVLYYNGVSSTTHILATFCASRKLQVKDSKGETECKEDSAQMDMFPGSHFILRYPLCHLRNQVLAFSSSFTFTFSLVH